MTIPPRFDPNTDAFAADPYAVYARLRSADAPLYAPELDMVLLARHADIVQIATDPHMVRSWVGHRTPEDIALAKRAAGFDNMPFHERFVQSNLLDTDGPEHGRLRRLVFGAFTSKAIARMETDVGHHVDRLLRALPRGEGVEFISACAAPLPGLVIGRFLGVPDADAPQLRHWSEAIVAYFDIGKTPEKKRTAETAVRDFHEYLLHLKAERSRTPKDDLLSTLIAQEEAGLFKDDELISTCMLILMAGHGSTIDAIGTGLLTLLRHPEAMQALRLDPSRLPSAIEEMFRYEPPLPFFHRHATVDVVIRGHAYPAGTSFGLLYASGNRDAAAFARPDSFDIHRTPNRHLAFGRGAHLCLGNQLARLNMRVLFGELLARFEDIELVQEPVFRRGLSARGLERLSIKFS